MANLTKDDLSQINRDYFQSLERERLVEVTVNLHHLAVEQYERLKQDSHNSSCPPSSDNPYLKKSAKSEMLETETGEDKAKITADETAGSSVEPPPRVESEAQSSQVEENCEIEQQKTRPSKKSAGKQPGAPGKWRSVPLVSEETIPHVPKHCAARNEKLTIDSDLKPDMGYYTLELEKQESGFRIRCNLHHY